MRFKLKTNFLNIGVFLFLLVSTGNTNAQVAQQQYSGNAVTTGDASYLRLFNTQLGALKRSINARRSNRQVEPKTIWSGGYDWMTPDMNCPPGNPTCVTSSTTGPTEEEIEAAEYEAISATVQNPNASLETLMSGLAGANGYMEVLGGAMPTMWAVWAATDPGVQAGMWSSAMLSETKAISRINAEQLFFTHAQANPSVSNVIVPMYMHCLSNKVSQPTAAGTQTMSRMEAMDVCLGDARIARGNTQAWNTGTFGTSYTNLDNPAHDPADSEFEQCAIKNMINQEKQILIAAGGTGAVHDQLALTVSRLLGDICTTVDYPTTGVATTATKDVVFRYVAPSLLPPLLPGPGGPQWYMNGFRQQVWEDMFKIQFQLCEERMTPPSILNPHDIASAGAPAPLSHWENIQEELIVSASAPDFEVGEEFAYALNHFFVTSYEPYRTASGHVPLDCPSLRVWDPGNPLHYDNLIDAAGNLIPQVAEDNEMLGDIYRYADYVAGLKLIALMQKVRTDLNKMTARFGDPVLTNRVKDLFDIVTDKEDIDTLRVEAAAELVAHVNDVAVRASNKTSQIETTFASVYGEAARQRSGTVPGGGSI